MAGVVPGSRSGAGNGHAPGLCPGNGHSHGLVARDLQISEDEKSESSGSKKRRQSSNNDDNSDAAAGRSFEGDQLGSEINRRPRGRPPGSKNKKKPPIIVKQESANALRAHVLEIANGCDVVESLATFARRRQRGLCILSGSGTVSNVTLRQPGTGTAVMTLHGCFEILSFSGAFLPTTEPAGATGLTIYVAGAQGQVMGGRIVGALLASSPVVVMAATFRSTPYERLPQEEDEGVQSQRGLSQSTAGTAAPPLQQQMPHPSSMPIFNVTPNLLPNGQLPHDFYGWAQHPRPAY